MIEIKNRYTGAVILRDESALTVRDALVAAVAGGPHQKWLRGKSGGVRVIYYVHSEFMPLYLLTLFAKNERANISKAQRHELSEIIDLLVQIWFES